SGADAPARRAPGTGAGTHREAPGGASRAALAVSSRGARAAGGTAGRRPRIACGTERAQSLERTHRVPAQRWAHGRGGGVTRGPAARLGDHECFGRAPGTARRGRGLRRDQVHRGHDREGSRAVTASLVGALVLALAQAQPAAAAGAAANPGAGSAPRAVARAAPASPASAPATHITVLAAASLADA